MPDPSVPESLPDAPPLTILARWIADAQGAGLPVPSAMTLATAGVDGPRARTVLVTEVDDEAARFHSSTPTGKTVDLATDPRVCGVFHWPSFGRQAVLTGRAVELGAAVSDVAFAGRPDQLRRIAWAYDTLVPELADPDRSVAPHRIDAAAVARPDRPPSWITIALVPERIELWRAGTEEILPARTRFVLGSGGWRSFPVLP